MTPRFSILIPCSEASATVVRALANEFRDLEAVLPGNVAALIGSEACLADAGGAGPGLVDEPIGRPLIDRPGRLSRWW